jgi:hypothetical protein
MAWVTVLAAMTLPPRPLHAQTGGTCEPVSQRAGRELGCFITAREELGALSSTPALYWHIDRYPIRAAAQSAKGPRGTVVESLGKVWLFTIADSSWRSTGGEHLATIGPLPLLPAEKYSAVYLEGVFQPGMQSRVHRHPGVEAWYTLEGSMCVETSEGTLVQGPGDPGVMAKGGLPMILTGTGKGVRRSLVLILQDSAKPRSTPADDWKPKGLCKP